jgi:hypothetical protein
MKSSWLFLRVLLVALLWTGCATVTTQLQEVRHNPTGIASDDSVAILASTESPLENEAIGCITEALRGVNPAMPVITSDEFRRTIFSYRIPEDGNERAKYLTLLVNQPALREHMASRGIRYLISVLGTTEQSWESKGGCVPVVGPGGGAIPCLGMFVATRDTRLAASIVDVRQGLPAGESEISSSGRPWIAYAGIVPFVAPVGLPAFTETQACRDLGAAVARFLAGENPSDTQKEEKHPNDDSSQEKRADK